jgi:hypothetical protein
MQAMSASRVPDSPAIKALVKRGLLVERKNAFYTLPEFDNPAEEPRHD